MTPVLYGSDDDLPELRATIAGPGAAVTSAAFHAHLDSCRRCRHQPFNLCPTGAQLLEAAATLPPISPPSPPEAPDAPRP